jgi:hypothetical protein
MKTYLKQQALPITLITLMALTRVHHFGSAFLLPDASLAVFFLAGMWWNRSAFLGLLLIEAGVVDYLAINQFDVSDWCMSPAYVGLIPTYATLWLAGHYCKKYNALDRSEMIFTMAGALLAISAAFVISNGTFFLFSGRYNDLSWLDYAARVAQYYPSYVLAAMIYVALGLAMAKIIKLFPDAFARHQEA